MKADDLFEKGNLHLKGARMLLKGKTAEGVTARELDDVATQLMLAARLFLRLAGQADLKPADKPKLKSTKVKDRVKVKDGFTSTIDLDQGNDLLGKGSKPRRKRRDNE